MLTRYNCRFMFLQVTSFSSLSILDTTTSSNNQTNQSTCRDWIIYKTSDFIVLNKPCGISVKDKSGTEPTVQSQLHTLKFSSTSIPQLCHLLETEMSGALLLARSHETHQVILDQINTSNFWSRMYLGIIEIKKKLPLHGTISMPLRQHETMKHCVVPSSYRVGGLNCVTKWRLLSESSRYKLGLIELQPLSLYGIQRHHLRAHCAYGLGCPLLGDTVYDTLGDEWIHARGLNMLHFQKSQKNMLLNRVKNKNDVLYLHHRLIDLKKFGGQRTTILCPVPLHFRKLCRLIGWLKYLSPIDKPTVKRVWDNDSEDNLSNVLSLSNAINDDQTDQDHILDQDLERDKEHNYQTRTPLVLTQTNEINELDDFPELH